MDNHLFKLVDRAIPRFNPSIMNGLAVEQMRGVERYVDNLFRSISKSFPEGLTYEGFDRCTPQEEFNEITRKRGNRPTFDVARNDLFLVGYKFKYFGEPLDTRYMYLPFARQAGLITIRGSTFVISPVLADRAISYGTNNIFIPLQVTKLTFERQSYSFSSDGVRETVNVAWSTVYNRSQKNKGSSRPVVTAKHTLVHYMFCKYGVSETFYRIANAEVVVGYPDEVNYDHYPKEEWVICSSSRIRPKSVRLQGKAGYIASNLQLAIRRTDWSIKTASVIGGFFYIVDHFPQRVEPNYIDETRLWRILLGHLIFGSDQSEGKLAVEINNHIESLDDYVDEQSRLNLLSVGVKVENIYDLFINIIGTLAEMVVQSDIVESTMYDKEMMVLRYALFDINKAISLFKFALQKAVKKTNIKNEINRALQRHLNQDAITKINRSHGEVSGISSPGDNMYFKITSNLVPQTSATGGGRSSKKTALMDPSKFLHSSIADVGSYNNLPKSSPDGRTRVGVCVELDANYQVVPSRRYRALLQDCQRKFQR